MFNRTNDEEAIVEVNLRQMLAPTECRHGDVVALIRNIFVEVGEGDHRNIQQLLRGSLGLVVAFKEDGLIVRFFVSAADGASVRDVDIHPITWDQPGVLVSELTRIGHQGDPGVPYSLTTHNHPTPHELPWPLATTSIAKTGCDGWPRAAHSAGYGTLQS